MKKENNFNTCKLIAEEIERYAAQSNYKCPHCGAVAEIPEFEKNEYTNYSDELCHICPECGTEIIDDDLETCSIYDYLEKDLYDIEYRIDGNKNYRSVKIMIACGGPNIYIDTACKEVLLYWGNEKAFYPISYCTCSLIDDYFEEMFNW